MYEQAGGQGALRLSVVLPCFNEAGNVAAMVERLDRALAGIGWEAIFVDDDSPDGTAQIVRDMARADRRVRVIQRIGRRGLASACIEGMCAAAAPHVAVIDADGQHDERLLPRMLAVLEAGEADVAIGSRFVDGGGIGDWDPGRARQSALATRMARMLTGTEITDPMSGFFMLEAARLRSLAPGLSGVGFKILLDLLATSPKPLRIRELPYVFALRTEGESKLDHVIMFEYLVGLYDRLFGRIVPTRFMLFGTIGALGVGVHFAVLGLLFSLAGTSFGMAQSVATLVAMTFNFLLNNALTYRDKRLSGAGAMVRGWAVFVLFCSVGALANIAVATLLFGRGSWWPVAALAGIVIGSVWNFALSSRFVWGRY